MANLLPLEAQKNVWLMYRARFVIVLSLALFGLALLALVALLPGYIALSFATPDMPDGPSLNRDPMDDPTAVARAQALVDALGPVLSATSSPTEVIRSVITARPSGVTIEHISYRSGQMVVSGRAPRETIDSFRTTLATNPLFTSVSVPVAALVGREGNKFSITLSGTF